MWKGAYVPVTPLLKGQVRNAPLFHRSTASLKLAMMMLCNGQLCPRTPLSKVRGQCPRHEPRSVVLHLYKFIFMIWVTKMHEQTITSNTVFYVWALVDCVSKTQNTVQSGPDLPTGLSLGQWFIASIRPAWGIDIRRRGSSTTPPIHLFEKRCTYIKKIGADFMSFSLCIDHLPHYSEYFFTSSTLFHAICY